MHFVKANLRWPNAGQPPWPTSYPRITSEGMSTGYCRVPMPMEKSKPPWYRCRFRAGYGGPRRPTGAPASPAHYRYMLALMVQAKIRVG